MEETLDTLAARIDALGYGLGARMDRFAEQVNRNFKLVDDRFQQLERRLEVIDARFARIDERFVQIDARFVQIEGHLTKLSVGLDDANEKLIRVLDGYKSLAEKDEANIRAHENIYTTINGHHMHIAMLAARSVRPPTSEPEPPPRSGPALLNTDNLGR